METFIVRVYRSVWDTVPDDDRLRGVVEDISTGFQATFHDCKQLLSILHRPRPGKPGVPPRGAAEAARTSYSQPPPTTGRES